MNIIRRILIHIKWRLDQIGFFDSMNDRTYLKFNYYLRVGKVLNLDNPSTFNEKLQWLKINDRNPNYTRMVDKVSAKEYVKERIGEEYIIPNIGVYDDFNSIDFKELPKRFVIKCTHNSGGVVVVNDKTQINIPELRNNFKRMLKKNFFYNGREWPYKNITPRIIIEENIQDGNSSIQINDYKIMCFNGKARCAFVCSNRNSRSGLCVNFYDMEWNPMPFERHYPRNPIEIRKPLNFDKMVELSEKLAKDIPFVRVDFYEKQGKLYFGELTFYPGGGVEEFTPDSWDYVLGSWLNLKL